LPGVGVVITDDSKSQFYIQQKDETYPVPEYRHLYSFFGGSIEPGEDELGALERELGEELNHESARTIVQAVKKIGDFAVSTGNIEFSYTLFEAKLPLDYLNLLKEIVVKEGRGFLMTKEEFAHLEFIWKLDGVRDFYLAHQ